MTGETNDRQTFVSWLIKSSDFKGILFESSILSFVLNFHCVDLLTREGFFYTFSINIWKEFENLDFTTRTENKYWLFLLQLGTFVYNDTEYFIEPKHHENETDWNFEHLFYTHNDFLLSSNDNDQTVRCPVTGKSNSFRFPSKFSFFNVDCV